ncbi:MAG: hypothetical protein JNK04_14720, partial [Myxococcales bacterium]|nr:hypothetical protein [Myxococcales bacterium]
GGPMRLVAPFGPQIGLALGVGRRIVDDNLRSSIDVARVRQVRLLAPLDVLPDLTPAEWAMAAALNDLMQVTNHELSGALTRGRHATLLEATGRLIDAILPPRTTLEVIVRHATFARMSEIARKDTSVSGWIGTAQFRGTAPASRYGRWPGLKGLSMVATSVPLARMTEGLDVIPADAYLPKLLALLARSPLTDLASVARDGPPFTWSVPTLSLVSYPVGRALALRALVRAPSQSAVAALREATDRLPGESPARRVAEQFAREYLARASTGNAARR